MNYDWRIWPFQTPEEFEVKSLDEYNKLISTKGFKNMFFRGEPKKYEEISASAFRNDGHVKFLEMKDDFKKEVWHRLNDDERKHFLAFAQHYSVSTNLIDFTTSSLIALFFACNSECKEDGLVYILDGCVDITSCLSIEGNENILELIAKGDNEFILKLVPVFKNFKKDYPDKFEWCVTKLNIQSRQYNVGKYNENLTWDDVTQYSWGKQISKEDEDVYFYLLKLHLFLDNLLDNKSAIKGLCLPYFKYSPDLNFERGKNQKGLFMYQSYLFYKRKDEANNLACQYIQPDKVIIIHNKEEILKELDEKENINFDYIYGSAHNEFDDIAKNIRKKYPIDPTGPTREQLIRHLMN